MRLRAYSFRFVTLSIVAVFATSFSAFAQSSPPKPATAAPGAPAAGNAPQPANQHFAGTAANFGSITGERILIDLIRWSTPEEGDPLATAARDKPASDVGAALKALPNLGYIWRSGSGIGAVIRHAASWKDASGEHVVLVTDSDLNAWRQGPAAPATAARPFTVLEIVIPASGTGTGKLSLDAKVIGNIQHKTLGIEGYAAAPVMVTGVRRTRGAI